MRSDQRLAIEFSKMQPNHNYNTRRIAALHTMTLTSRSARQILIHGGVFVNKPKVPSPALNNESILVKILG